MAGDEIGKIHRARVTFNDFDILMAAKMQPQLRRQHAVNLDGDQPPRPNGQRLSQLSASRPDLDHRGVADFAQRLYHSLCG